MQVSVKQGNSLGASAALRAVVHVCDSPSRRRCGARKTADDFSLVVFIEGTLACYNIQFICSGALMFLSFKGVRLLLLLLLCNNRFV